MKFILFAESRSSPSKKIEMHCKFLAKFTYICNALKLFFQMIERNDYLNILYKWKNKQVFKVITGIRRCGKSTLLKMFKEKLLKEGVEESQIIWLNFEDLDNEPLLDYKTLYAHVKRQLHPGAMNYLFFDEIQLVANFQKVIDSLLLKDNVDIYVTGSNAYLLSGEIATLLTGRYVEIKMHPLSFKEYVSAFEQPAPIENIYRSYIEFGAFPYILQLTSDRELANEYLAGLYNTIVLKDVVARKRISDVMMLESVVKFLADNIGNLTASKRISDTMTSAGRKISSHTVENYISALSDSFIFYPVTRYDTKGMQYLKTGQKYYLADVGLRNIIVGTKGGDMGHILENVIYLELLRRGGEIYVGKNDNAEIDFIVIKGGMKEYYQVSLSVRDARTLQRELAPLQTIPDHNPKFLLTLDNDPVTSHNGIKQIYALDWLLDKHS